MTTKAMQALPEDHPLMLAWEAFRATPEATNAAQWAHFVQISAPMQGTSILTHPHLVGSLWCFFVAGYAAAGGKTTADD